VVQSRKMIFYYYSKRFESKRNHNDEPIGYDTMFVSIFKGDKMSGESIITLFATITLVFAMYYAYKINKLPKSSNKTSGNHGDR